MAFAVEASSNELVVAGRRVEALALLADTAPARWRRRNAGVVEARTLWPDTGVENSDNGAFAVACSGPRAIGGKP